MRSRSLRRFVHVDRRLLRRDDPSPQHKDTTLRNALAKPRAGRCCPTMIKDSLRSAEPNGRPRPVGGAELSRWRDLATPSVRFSNSAALQFGWFYSRHSSESWNPAIPHIQTSCPSCASMPENHPKRNTAVSSGLSHMNGFSTVIPAKAGIQWPKSSVSLRKCSLWRCLDSGESRSDRVGISYAIALAVSFASLAALCC